jgi:hypothetical protein
MDDNLDEADPVHGQSSRPSDKMSTRDDVLRGRNARQTGDAAMTRNYVELPGTKFGVSSQATIGDIKTYGDKVVHDRPTSLTTKVKKVIDRDDPHDSEFDRDRLSHHHKDEIKMGDSWDGDLEEGEYEVEAIVDVRSGRKTRYGRVHRQFLVKWKGYPDLSWVDEADLSCGAILQEFERNRVSRNRFEVMQSHEGKSDEP